MRKNLEILYRDDDFVAIHKPSGYHVHPPELDGTVRVRRDRICMWRVRNQIGRWVYPIHRLDAATSGVLVFALNKETASAMGRMFTTAVVRKIYFAIVRGYAPDGGVVEVELKSDSSNEMLPAVTEFRTLARAELPFQVGKRHPTARYSLVEARPRTGRFHQIRRHMARLSHPIVGDAMHGDSHHNRFFREQLDCPGLRLKAQWISFEHPRTGARVEIESPWGDEWPAIFDKLGFSAPIIDADP